MVKGKPKTSKQLVQESLNLQLQNVGLGPWFPDPPVKKKGRYTPAIVFVSQVASVLTIPDMILYSRRFWSRDELLKVVVNPVVLLGVAYNLGFRKWGDQYRETFEELETSQERVSQRQYQRIYRRHFDLAHERSRLFLKVNSVFMSVALTSIVVLGALMSGLVEKSTFPMPTFHQLSFLPITGGLSYVVNFLHQIVVFGFTSLNCQVFLGVIFHLSFMTIAKLNATIEIVELQGKVEGIPFKEWLCVVTEVLKFFRHANSLIFYLIEKCSVTLTIAAYVIWTVDPAKIGLAFGSFMFTFMVAVIVLLNETFLDKFSRINETAYNLAWYEMSTKDQKSLKLLLQASQHPISLSSGGISDLTLMWLSNVISAGYKTGLVLEGFIKG